MDRDRNVGVTGRGYGRESYAPPCDTLPSLPRNMVSSPHWLMPHLYADAQVESLYGNMIRIRQIQVLVAGGTALPRTRVSLIAHGLTA